MEGVRRRGRGTRLQTQLVDAIADLESGSPHHG